MRPPRAKGQGPMSAPKIPTEARSVSDPHQMCSKYSDHPIFDQESMNISSISGTPRVRCRLLTKTAKNQDEVVKSFYNIYIYILLNLYVCTMPFALICTLEAYRIFDIAAKISGGSLCCSASKHYMVVGEIDSRAWSPSTALQRSDVWRCDRSSRIYESNIRYLIQGCVADLVVFWSRV